MKAVQTRRICGITYLTIDDLLKVIRSKDNIIRNYAFIEHNCDVHETDDEKKGYKKGDIKERHIHFILLFNFPYKLSTVSNWFQGWFDDKQLPINTFCEPCSDLSAYYRYFTHSDNPDKFQYDDKLIYCYDSSEFKSEDNSCEDKAFIALDLLLNGVSKYEIAKRLGRDFIYHYSHILQLYEDIQQEERAKKYKLNKKECERKFIENVETCRKRD